MGTIAIRGLSPTRRGVGFSPRGCFPTSVLRVLKPTLRKRYFNPLNRYIFAYSPQVAQRAGALYDACVALK